MLDPETVVGAGVHLARAGGLDGLGVRPLAATLGVTPMALYRHVGDAAGLHTAVVDQLLEELPLVSEAGRWDGSCRAWAVELRAVLSQTPGMARYLLMHWTALPRAVVMVDRLGALLEGHGPSGVDAVAASNALFTYVLARVQAEETVAHVGRKRDLARWSATKAETPFMHAHRAEYEVARFDEHFSYGLDALILGLVTARRRRRART